jgi:hypothetical protein
MIDVNELIESLMVIAYDDIAPIRRAQILHVIGFLQRWSKEQQFKAN